MRRKILIISLISILVISTCIVIVICGAKEEKPIELTIYIARTVDGEDVMEQITMTQDTTYQIKEYERCESLMVWATGRYVNDDTIAPPPPLTSFSDTKVDSLVPGVYVMTQTYEGKYKEIGHYFHFAIKILENRPTPEVVFDGGAKCISSDGNKFTYKCDGALNLPSAKIIHQGEVLAEVSNYEMGFSIYNAEMYNGESFVKVNSWLPSEPGIYRFTFHTISSLPQEIRDSYLDGVYKIIIEYVE